MADARHQLDKVKGIYFTNQGDCFCQASLKYTKPDGTGGTTNDWGMMEAGDVARMEPGDRGLSPGTVFQLYVDAIAGVPRTGISFVYGAKREAFANISLTGSGIFTELHYDGIAPPPNP